MKEDKIETGRSMVEMLGVLAIIGVLSVGGIAGYNMAVDRYKTNKIYSLLDAFSVAAVAEKEKGADSFLLSTELTGREKNDLFCDLYLPGNCETVYEYNGSTDENYYLLTAKLSISPTLAGGHYWRVNAFTAKPGRCYCKSDLTLVVTNIPKQMCENLIDLAIANYADKGLVGFSGNDHGALSAGEATIKKMVCPTEKNSMTFVFEGYDDAIENCGSCTNLCPC